MIESAAQMLIADQTESICLFQLQGRFANIETENTRRMYTNK